MKAKIIYCLLALLLAALPVLPQATAQKINQWLVLGPAEILADGAALPAGEDAALDYDFLPTGRLRPAADDKAQWSTQRQLSLAAGGQPASPGRLPSRRSIWPFTWKASAGCRPNWTSKRLFPSGSILTAALAQR